MENINRRELYEQFNKEFPIESLKTMPIEKYTNLDRDNSFCYWMERRTRMLGSILGGASAKFGIYMYNNRPKETDTTLVFDDTYAWYAKYNKARAHEAYEVVRNTIVSIAEHARKGELEAIDQIDTLGDVYKWKIALRRLYQLTSEMRMSVGDNGNTISFIIGGNKSKQGLG